MVEIGDNFKCYSRNFNKYLNNNGYEGKHYYDDKVNKEYWLYKVKDQVFIEFLIKWKQNKEKGIKEIN